MGESAWMLDTNTLSDLIRNPRGPVRDRLAATAPDDVCKNITFVLGPVLARTRLAIRWRHPSALLTAEYRP